MNTEIRRDAREVLVNETTGRTIWWIAGRGREETHTYYDICPWSPDGRHILFSSADPGLLRVIGEQVNLETDAGQLCICDTESWDVEVIAEHLLFSSGGGVRAMWGADGSVYFCPDNDTLAVMELPSREVLRTMPQVATMLSPDGTQFAATLEDPDAPSNGHSTGAFTMNADGTDVRRIASTRELYEITPNKADFLLEHMRLGHTKWSPDSSHVMVAMWGVLGQGAGSRVRRSLYVMRRDGSEQRWLCYFGGHHIWSPDGSQILFAESRTWEERGTGETRLFLVNADGSDKHMVVDHQLGGHPIIDPAGATIVTETRTTTMPVMATGLCRVDIQSQTVEDLVVFERPFDMGKYHTRGQVTPPGRYTHPHAVFNRDGSQLLYSSAETGTSQIYILPLEG